MTLDYALLWVAILTLAATTTIPVILYLNQQRSQKQMEEIVKNLTQYASGARADQLALLALTSPDMTEIGAALIKARALVDDQDQGRVIRAHFLNPAVALVSPFMESSRIGLQASTAVLDQKLAHRSLAEGLFELQDFLRLCRSEKVYPAQEVADWVWARVHQGEFLRHSDLHDILVAADSAHLFSALLNPLRGHLPHRGGAVSLLAGVCTAYLARLGDWRVHPGLEKDRHNQEVGWQVASSLGYSLEMGALNDLANWPRAHGSMPSDGTAALVVAVCGATSCVSNEIADQLARNLPKMNLSRQTLGRDDEFLDFGIERFQSHHPGIANYYRVHTLGEEQHDGTDQ